MKIFMKTTWNHSVFSRTCRALLAAVVALAGVPALATTFTNNTAIAR
jgi:hypothetical protein